MQNNNSDNQTQKNEYKKYAEGMMQHAYEYGKEGLVVAGMGIGLTAGGGGNIPVCLAALFIAGVGGAMYGAASYAWNAVGTQPQVISQPALEKKDNNPNVVVYGKNVKATLFSATQDQNFHAAHLKASRVGSESSQKRP